jgi:hypothetical protein
MPASPEPFRPTAMQRRGLGHEIAVSAGVAVSPSGWATHVFPPSTVASMTVPDDGVREEEVVPAAADDAGVPTAQQ